MLAKRMVGAGTNLYTGRHPRKSHVPGPPGSMRDVADVLLGTQFHPSRKAYASKVFALDQGQSTGQLVRHLRPLASWNRQRFAYVSTPITGGERLYEYLASCGVKSKKDLTPEQMGGFYSKVIQANSRAAAEVSHRLRDHKVATLNPSAANFPGWKQTQYNANWTGLLQNLALDAVVLCPGWQLSYGCLLEVRSALDHDIPLKDDSLRPLSRKDLSEQVEAAVVKARARGFEVSDYLPKALTAPLQELPLEI